MASKLGNEERQSAFNNISVSNNRGRKAFKQFFTCLLIIVESTSNDFNEPQYVVNKTSLTINQNDVFIMACHILYGRPYCNDAKEGIGGITPPNLNRGGWNSARTKYFEGNVMCKNLGAIGSGRGRGAPENVPRRPQKIWLFSVHTTTHDLTHFPSADFHEIFAKTRGSVSC